MHAAATRLLCATFETLDRGATMVAEEIERFEAGGWLLNVINPQVLAR